MPVLVDFPGRPDGGRIAIVTIDNAAKLNTLNRAIMTEFIAAMADLAQDRALRAVVLTGSGERAFVGGADIAEMAALEAASARAFITLVHRSCDALRRLPVPVIARVQGFALGAGMELAAACDLRVAADTARFGMPEVKLGIPSVVEAALLPGLIGWGRTRELLLLGEVYPAAEAAAWGFLEKVVPAAELDAAVETWLASLISAGPEAIKLQKRLIRRWEELPIPDAVEAGIDFFAASWASDEPGRMMAEFLARRAATKKS
jgi:enoyl-CoA hydratase/carnithine racemase